MTALCTLTAFPLRGCFSFIPLLKWPEQILAKATLSLCFASIFACILNTKPETFLSEGSISLVSVFCDLGAGAKSDTPCNNSRTPKLLIALPK